MPIPYLCIFAFVIFLQAEEPAAVPGEIFIPVEKARIEKAADVEQRIKVYDTAAKRIQQEVETAVTREEFQSVPDGLRLWTSLLAKSLEDIEVNLKANKKPRSLINYEIQLRKSIGRTESLKIRAPVDQQDIFDSSLEQAEKIRKRLFEILFRH